MKTILPSSRTLIPISIIGINILVWSGMLVINEGVIIQRDFNFPYIDENFVKAYYPIWNDISSRPNTENLPRIVMYLPFITMAALGLEVTLILKILIITTFIFLTAAMYLFCSNVLKRLNVTVKGYQWISLGSAFIFAYNPVNLYFAQSISLLVSLGALPLLLYFILTKINSKYFPLYMTLALLLSMGHPFNFVMNVLIGNTLLLAINLHKISIRLLLFKTGITTITFFLIFSWFLLPYISNPLSSIDLGRESQLSRSIFEIVSENNPFKIVLLERDQFQHVVTAPADFLSVLAHYISLAALIIIALSVNFYRKLMIRTRYLLLLSSIGFLFCTLLAMGDNGPIGEQYYDLITSSSVGWIFRSPLKFQMYQLFFIIPLFAISVALLKQKFLNKHNKNLVTEIIIIFILIGSSAYGIYHANVFTFSPINLPTEYFEINDLLKRQYGTDSRVLYYPLYDEHPTKWSLGHYIASYEAKSSQVPTFQLSNNYNYVKDVLNNYPSNNGLFSSSGFYDLISALGVGYIVFHNDTGNELDQENLQRLLDSEDVETVYAKNDWYLFKILNRQVDQAYLVDSLALVDGIPQIYSVSSPSLGVVTLNDTDTKLEVGDELVKLTILNDTIKSSFENILANSSFDKQGGDTQETAVPLRTNWAEFNERFAESDPIPVSSGYKYLFEAGPLSNSTLYPHLQVRGYNPSKDAWQNIVLTGVIDFKDALTYLGENHSIEYWKYFTDYWKYPRNYWKVFDIPENITQIKFVINTRTIFGGDNDPVGLTHLDKLAVYNLDHRPNDTSSIQYYREDPTTLRVRFNITSPSLLVFPETYDKGWKAVAGNQSIDSIKVFGTVNGFPINKEGEYDIIIEYEPQKWLEVGIVVSIVTIISYFILITKGSTLSVKIMRILKTIMVTGHKISFEKKRD